MSEDVTKPQRVRRPPREPGRLEKEALKKFGRLREVAKTNALIHGQKIRLARGKDGLEILRNHKKRLR